MIRILIADDHNVVRGGLKQIVAAIPGAVVAGEASCGDEVLNSLRTHEFDLLLSDMSMPGISGVDLIRRVRSEKPSLPILVLSMHNEAQIVARALKAGASGYVTKDSEPEVLMSAIRKVMAGGKYIDPVLMDAMLSSTVDMDRPPHELLSDREFQVLQMIAAGHPVGEIANLLSLSAKTVSTHKTRLMEKLGVSNNADLLRYSIRHKL